MSTIFNRTRVYVDGETPSYPLFMGENLSLHDAIDTQYPELEKLALLQRDQFWKETEFDLTSDNTQWPSIPKNTQDIAIYNLSWQALGDSIVGRAPIMALMPFCTNPELEEVLVYWQFFEAIHSRSYQHIIRSVFPDPERVRNEMANLEEAMDRLDIVAREFEQLSKLSCYYTLIKDHGMACLKPIEEFEKECRIQIIKTLAALYALESIQFFSSFACTFALARQDMLTGVADIVTLIAKDESLHTRFALQIMEILKRDPAWKDDFDIFETYFEETVLSIVEAEKRWAKFLLSEGRQIVGLNQALLIEYIDYLGTASMRAIGLSYPTPVNVNPIKWIDNYLKPEMVQVAPQERDIKNYRTGAMDGNVGDLSEFDDF